MKKALRIGLYILSGIFGVLLLFFVFLLIKSPGKPRPFKDINGSPVAGSIALIESVPINGVDQKMIIRGRDSNKPVLLYLHGGPGSPEFPFVRQFGSKIEDLFVVCYWDQRGAGMSYSKDIPPETMTLPQFVDDAGVVSRYLMKKFQREKIYLMGHSWGSLLGSFTAQKFPELFYAYISIGQVALQARAEEISYDFVLSRARELKEQKAVAKLEKIGPPPYGNSDESLAKLMIERKYVTRYGGATKKGNFMLGAAKSLVNCREYTFGDKIKFFSGMKFSLKTLWPSVMESNLFRDVSSQAIPIYIMQGTSDYQTAYEVAKEYFDSLQAPVKHFFPFENSAHSPNFEEPARFEGILSDILAGKI